MTQPGVPVQLQQPPGQNPYVFTTQGAYPPPPQGIPIYSNVPYGGGLIPASQYTSAVVPTSTLMPGGGAATGGETSSGTSSTWVKVAKASALALLFVGTALYTARASQRMARQMAIKATLHGGEPFYLMTADGANYLIRSPDNKTIDLQKDNPEKARSTRGLFRIREVESADGDVSNSIETAFPITQGGRPAAHMRWSVGPLGHDDSRPVTWTVSDDAWERFKVQLISEDQSDTWITKPVAFDDPSVILRLLQMGHKSVITVSLAAMSDLSRIAVVAGEVSSTQDSSSKTTTGAFQIVLRRPGVDYDAK